MPTAHVIEAKERTDDIQTDKNFKFENFLLSPQVLHGLKNAGFLYPSPIQQKAIPLVKCGIDVVCQAKSGTGKTCVFAVAALESIDVVSCNVQVLILAPTREIAAQIKDVIVSIGASVEGLKCSLLIGGIAEKEDVESLKGCHIAVGTPGRVRSLIEKSVLLVSSVRLFVLDEADKLLESSMQDQINWIFSTLPEHKQTLALSATFPSSLEDFLNNYMKDPSYVRIHPNDLALKGVKQYFCDVQQLKLQNKVFEEKSKVLIKLLSQIPFHQCMVFSNFNARAEHLCNILTKEGWPSAFIAGKQAQTVRLKAMDKLKKFDCRILVTTDLTSRGIDCDKVNLVINLDLPWDTETYLHRIGRAGRFGSHATAISIVSHGKECDKLKTICVEMRKKISHITEYTDRNGENQSLTIGPLILNMNQSMHWKDLIGHVNIEKHLEKKSSSLRSTADDTNNTVTMVDIKSEKGKQSTGFDKLEFSPNNEFIKASSKLENQEDNEDNKNEEVNEISDKGSDTEMDVLNDEVPPSIIQGKALSNNASNSISNEIKDITEESTPTNDSVDTEIKDITDENTQSMSFFKSNHYSEDIEDIIEEQVKDDSKISIKNPTENHNKSSSYLKLIRRSKTRSSSHNTAEDGLTCRQSEQADNLTCCDSDKSDSLTCRHSDKADSLNKSSIKSQQSTSLNKQPFNVMSISMNLLSDNIANHLNMRPMSQDTQLNMRPMSQDTQLNMRPTSQDTQLNMRPTSQDTQLNMRPTSKDTQLNMRPMSQDTQFHNEAKLIDVNSNEHLEITNNKSLVENDSPNILTFENKIRNNNIGVESYEHCNEYFIDNKTNSSTEYSSGEYSSSSEYTYVTRSDLQSDLSSVDHRNINNEQSSDNFISMCECTKNIESSTTQTKQPKYKTKRQIDMKTFQMYWYKAYWNHVTALSMYRQMNFQK